MSRRKEIVVVCADIGSISQGKFGWWSSADKKWGNDLQSLSDHVASKLIAREKVALGFECPLFVPLRDEVDDLTKQRDGERGRPWSASAGCTVLTTGLVQVAWILKEVRLQLKKRSTAVPAFLEWKNFQKAKAGLLLWEAFISSDAKNSKPSKGAKKETKENPHIADAKAGVEAFINAGREPQSAIRSSSKVYSLVGAALLRTGWSNDVALLEKKCLVIRPDKK